MKLSEKKTRHILLVEDNESSRILMKEAFDAVSFEGRVDMVESGDEAMEFLRQKGKYADAQKPDIVLLDLNLPGKNGLEIVSEIRSDKHLQNLCVIILTGSNASSDIEACTRLHCKYLLKPSRFHEVIELVKVLPGFC
jgi:CheY-like chemotaxis protein